MGGGSGREGGGYEKLNAMVWRKSARQNSLQWAKHARLYSDILTYPRLYTRLIFKPWIALGSPLRVYVRFCAHGASSRAHNARYLNHRYFITGTQHQRPPSRAHKHQKRKSPVLRHGHTNTRDSVKGTQTPEIWITGTASRAHKHQRPESPVLRHRHTDTRDLNHLQ